VVRIEISNGTNTYTIFEWGDGSVDPNTIITSLSILPETDSSVFINAGFLYPPSGVAIDIDDPALNGGAGIPPGIYNQIIITALDGAGPGYDGTFDIDGIQVLP
jgi:hypothetical protein